MTNGVYTTFSPDVTAQNIYDIYGDWYPEFWHENFLKI